MNYLEISFHLHQKDKDGEDWIIDLLKEELLSVGFESFVDEEADFKGYVTEANFVREDFDATLKNFCEVYPQNVSAIDFEIATVPQQNWNVLWESNYESVIFDDVCCIRPPFKERAENVRYDIEIEANMSFGTAHHPTTALMITLLVEEKLPAEKKLMDMGCGTAVLAILAKKLGFGSVVAVDNDCRAVETSIRNAEQNNVDIEVLLLDDYKPEPEFFDVFLVNINRNTLLKNFASYAQSLKSSGKLIMSGFFEADSDVLIAKSKYYNLKFKEMRTKNDWAVLVFQK
ncbi:MAG: 50S ribosomal protein L11 methyltransferase [Bacteroidales bacterium]|jgi:ribosomal protein L11 methyltransferase|nr:50S ribosomal protein L11 methyltransferase [Bacteroidales bacterium]